MKSTNTKQRLFEVMSKVDKTFKLNEIGGYNGDWESEPKKIDQPTEEFLPITTPLGSADSKLFAKAINVGIDSHLEGFTKSKFSKKGDRLVLDFAKSELPILLRRLEEIGTDEALSWKEDIENYKGDVNEEEIPNENNNVKSDDNIKYSIDYDVFRSLYIATLLGGEFNNTYGHGKTEEGAISSLKLRVNQLRNKRINEEETPDETNNVDLLEFTIPEWALSTLINNDNSGNSDEDDQKINAFVQGAVSKYGNANFMLGDIDGKDDLGFRHSNDIDNLGADCYRLYLKPSK